MKLTFRILNAQGDEMESYIEISFVNQILLMVLSILIAGYITCKPVCLKENVIYSVSISLFCSLFWGTYSWLLYMCLEVFFFLLYFRYRLKTYFVYGSLRFLLSFTCYALWKGSYHLGMYYVPLHQKPFLFWTIEIILLISLLRKWKYFLGKLNYIYECTIQSNHKKFSVCAYLDSGNLLTLQGIPVVFLDPKYTLYFQGERMQFVNIQTVQGEQEIGCYEALIEIKGYASQHVYVHCKQNIKLPFRCELLLNMKLLMG